jgi:hypothetical protein
MESELGALIESLRTGANRLNADLQLLEGNLTEVSAAVAPRPRFEAEEPGSSAAPAVADASAAAATEAEPVDVGPAGAEEPPLYEPETAASNGSDVTEEAAGAEAGAVAGAGGGDGSGGEADAATLQEAAAPDDTEGARLIALNMALNGTPRDETERYLAENFQLPDRDGLLDEVYASVEG